MTDAELLAEVHAAHADAERAEARRVAAIRAAMEQRTRATTAADVAAAARMSKEAVYKLLQRKPA